MIRVNNPTQYLKNAIKDSTEAAAKLKQKRGRLTEEITQQERESLISSVKRLEDSWLEKAKLETSAYKAFNCGLDDKDIVKLSP
jgi:hypothetical protein